MRTRRVVSPVMWMQQSGDFVIIWNYLSILPIMFTNQIFLSNELSNILQWTMLSNISKKMDCLKKFYKKLCNLLTTTHLTSHRKLSDMKKTEKLGIVGYSIACILINLKLKGGSLPPFIPGTCQRKISLTRFRNINFYSERLRCKGRTKTTK